MNRIPPIVRCPICQPGATSYAGTVLNVVCKECRAQIKRASQ